MTALNKEGNRETEKITYISQSLEHFLNYHYCLLSIRCVL